VTAAPSIRRRNLAGVALGSILPDRREDCYGARSFLGVDIHMRMEHSVQLPNMSSPRVAIRNRTDDFIAGPSR
jgi:hypothetical protein